MFGTMNLKPVPRKVEPLNPHELFMSWSDESEYSVPYVELRYSCPCAGCVDEHTGKRMIRRESINPDVRPTGVQPVGRYALQFQWTDGHATGIYHYDRLFELCQTAGKKLR
jgi:DUF971 family protein